MGEIRFVGTGETRGYPYLVCKKDVVLVSVQQVGFQNSYSYNGLIFKGPDNMGYRGVSRDIFQPFYEILI